MGRLKGGQGRGWMTGRRDSEDQARWRSFFSLTQSKAAAILCMWKENGVFMLCVCIMAGYTPRRQEAIISSSFRHAWFSLFLSLSTLALYIERASVTLSQLSDWSFPGGIKALMRCEEVYMVGGG